MLAGSNKQARLTIFSQLLGAPESEGWGSWASRLMGCFQNGIFRLIRGTSGILPHLHYPVPVLHALNKIQGYFRQLLLHLKGLAEKTIAETKRDLYLHDTFICYVHK